jgi:hypothetical protein
MGRDFKTLDHRQHVLILNTEYWLLNTALAEPTKEVLQAPPFISHRLQISSVRNVIKLLQYTALSINLSAS